MKRLYIFVVVSVTIFISITARAQEYEYGSASELKGVTKVHIYTGPDMKARDRIIKEIEKKLPQIKVTERADAEVVLAYGATASTYLERIYSSGSATATSSGASGSSTSMPVYGQYIDGRGLVIKPGTGQKIRLLMDFQDGKKSVMERDPSTNFARAFIKAYEKANSTAK
jgi:hypothetical protein